MILKSANDELVSLSIRHAILLSRYKTSEVRAIIAFLNRGVFPDLLERITNRLSLIASRGYDSGAFTTQRYKDLVAGFSKIIDAGFVEAGGRVKIALKEFALAEARWAIGTMRKAAPIELSLTMPSVGQLNAIVTAQPVQGRLISEWFLEESKATVKRIQTQINIGIAEGETVDQMVARIRGTRALRYTDGILDRSRHNIEGVVRMAVTHVAAHSAEQTFKANDDLVKGVQIVATLDTRTCPICMDQDGNVYPVGAGPRPPFHLGGCRCHVVSILKSWKELGIALKEMDPGTRASMNGQVAANLTYGEWLATQSNAVQDEALGPARAALFRSGALTIDQFVDDKGKVLTLAQLQAIGA